MKVVNISLHITHSELIEFLKKWKNLFNLRVGAIMDSDSFLFLEISDDNNLDDLIKKSETIILSLSNFVYNENMTCSDFLELNPNVFSIDIGKENKTLLRESWFYSLKILNDEDSLKLWKKLGNEIKKKAITGGYSILKANNSRSYQKTLRYTQGAKEAFKNGKKILNPYNDKIRFELQKE